MSQQPSRVVVLFFALMVSNAFAAFDLSVQNPPRARQIPKDVSVHGEKRVDPYFWLREKENPDVVEYLKQENAYTEAVMAKTKPLQESLYNEILARIQETDLSVPTKRGAFLYYHRTEKGKQYPIYCRKASAPADALEAIILDVNALAVGEKFMEVGHFEISDDGRRLAYSIDRNGHRDYEVRVKDLGTGKELPQHIGTVASVEWAADNDTLFYVKEEPESKRAFRVEALNLATGRHHVVYEEKDEEWDVELSRSRDGRYLFCSTECKTATEVRFLRADEPDATPKLVVARSPEHEYFVDHREGEFYIVTNRGAKDFKIVTAPVATPDEAHWKEWTPARAGVKIEGIDLFKTFAVIHEREEGLPHFQVVEFENGARHRIAFPEPAYSADAWENPEYDTKEFRLHFDSPVTPASLYSYDPHTRKQTLLKQTPVLGGYDPGLYACERLWCTAKDGVKIPVSIVYRRDKAGAGPRPLYLYGYGSYGYALPDSFSSSRLSLLDRGWGFALAHVRGGGEMGEAWHDQGKMEHKMNTFTDFIACAEDLIARGLTRRDLIVASGGSAGGLLMGAVVNQRPDLFRGAIYDVPFVDVINTMLDASLPLTTSEYQEWGDPNQPKEYAWIRSYSPYDNVAKQAYPSILVNVSFHDSQVPYWEGAKLVAKLRTLKTDGNPLLLRTNLDAGHGGSSGRYDSLREIAFDYAFALTCLEEKRHE